MKKILALFMILISLLTMSSATAFAAKLPKDIKVTLDNQEIQYKIKPYVKNNDVMIPVRQTSNILGAKIRWDKKNKTVWVDFDMMHIELQHGKRELYIHRDADFSGIPQTVKLNTPIVSSKGKTYVPAQQFFECFGMTVSWDSSKRELAITKVSDDLSQSIPFAVITEDDVKNIEEIHQWYNDNAKKSGIYSKKYKDVMYVLIGAGKKPTGGYTMGINSITSASATKVYVSAFVKSPSPDMMVTQVETYPHMLVRIDDGKMFKKVDGEIQVITSDTILTEVVYEEINYDNIKDNDRLKTWFDDNNKTKGISYIRDGKYIYALIGAGERPTGGYSIDLNEIYYSNNNTVFISAKVNPPGDNVRVIMMITYPSMLIRIESDVVNSIIGEVVDPVTTN